MSEVQQCPYPEVDQALLLLDHELDQRMSRVLKHAGTKHQRGRGRGEGRGRGKPAILNATTTTTSTNTTATTTNYPKGHVFSLVNGQVEEGRSDGVMCQSMAWGARNERMTLGPEQNGINEVQERGNWKIGRGQGGERGDGVGIRRGRSDGGELMEGGREYESWVEDRIDDSGKGRGLRWGNGVRGGRGWSERSGLGIDGDGYGARSRDSPDDERETEVVRSDGAKMRERESGYGAWFKDRTGDGREKNVRRIRKEEEEKEEDGIYCVGERGEREEYWEKKEISRNENEKETEEEKENQELRSSKDNKDKGEEEKDEEEKERSTHDGNVNEGEEVEEEEEYAILDEFLDVSTRARLRRLTGKVSALTHALELARKECRELANSKREASRAAQAAEGERRALAKQILGLRQESARQQRTNAELRLRVKQLSQECQTLRKESHEARQKASSTTTSTTALHAQLTRSRGECASLKGQLTDTRTHHKEEVEGLRRRLADAEESRREVERERRDLKTLCKKQERMIDILTQQKNHLSAAKVVAGLEKKFLATIAPLNPT